MKDIEVKQEVEEVSDIEDCIPELTKLLEDVKRENVVENEQQPPDVLDILKSISNEESSNSADDADIQNLQELLKEKLNELAETDEALKTKSHSSSSQEGNTQENKDQRKRKPENDTREQQNEKRRKENVSQTEATSNAEGINTRQDTDTNIPKENEGISTVSIKPERLPAEEELKNILQLTSHSDEEPCSSNQIANSDQEMCFPDVPTQFPCEDNPPTDHFNFCNSDTDFYAPPLGHFLAQVEEDELECLPVVNSAGFTGMPTFKRIKLERPVSDQIEENVNTADETPREKRQRIFNTCMSLLERMELSEQSGKFIFTPTIAKADSSEVNNSVLLNISNVHYDFQAIGPTLNVSDWGLNAIGGKNAKIAKAIGISAPAYFSKIKQKSDTMAAKLIKVETDHREKNYEVETEVDEPNLSTFFKSTVTQTDPLVCQKCVARSRIVGHDVGVQTKAFAGSFGTQTYSTGEIHSEMTTGLSGSQLNALYQFASLIRDASLNPSVEMFQSRAMDIYSFISSSCRAPTRVSSHERPDEWRNVPPKGSSYPAPIPKPQHVQMPYGHERPSHLTHIPPPHRTPPHLPPTHLPPTHLPPSHMPPTHMIPAQNFNPSTHAMHRDPRQASINPSPPHLPPRDPRQVSINRSPPQSYRNPPPPAGYQPHESRIPGPLSHPPNGNSSQKGPPWQKNESRLGYGRGHRL